VQYGVLEDCEITSCAGAYGSPAFWGALLRRTMIVVNPGEAMPAVMIAGQTDAYDITRIYDCELVSPDHPNAIDTLAVSRIDAKIAHCRMNTDVALLINNLIGAPYNVVDADFDTY
jgi:hypothetical protein